MDRGLAGGVGQLARHRLEVLARGEEDHAAAGARVVVAGGVGLDEQERAADVDRERGVDRRGVELLQVLVAGHRVVGDEDVDVADGVRGGGERTRPARPGR